MELTLLGSVALLAFVIGGAGVMLVAAFRRTIELRGALMQAMARIERLEKAIASGQPIAAPGAETLAADVAPPSIPSSAIEPAGFNEAAAAALAEERIDPPPLGVLTFVAGLAAFAALAAAQVRWLSPQAGVELAAAVGLAVLGAAQWRRHVDRTPPTGLKLDAAALSALIALSIMAAAIVYGWAALHAISPIAALVCMSVIALAAAAFSTQHGPVLLGFALLAAAGAPALAPVDGHAPPLRYALLAAFTALTMVLARKRRAPVWAWLANLVALAWGFNGAAWGGDPMLVSAIGAYFAALTAFAIAYAWDAGAAPGAFPAFWRTPWTEPVLACAAIIAGASAGAALLTLAHPLPTGSASPGLVAMAVLAAIGAAARPGLWFAPFLALAGAACSIAFWPSEAHGFVDAPGLVILSATLALVFSIGGAAAMAGAKDARPGAALAALAPMLLFAAAHERIGGFGAREYWAAAALVIAALNALAYLQLSHAKADAAAPFAAGASLAFAAALYAATPAPLAPLALAAGVPLIALVHRWRGEMGLRAGALVLCVVVLIRLVTPEVFVATASPQLLLAELFLGSAAAALIAAFLFQRGSNAGQTCFALALLLTAICATLEARHYFTAGRIGAPYASLAELGANTLVWLALAVGLAWRFGTQTRAHLAGLRLVAFGAAGLNALLIGGVMLSPWWGAAPGQALGWPGFNLIEFAFALPALAFFGFAQLRAHQGAQLEAGAARVAALALLLLAVLLETRRLFYGAAMATASVSAPEAWAYSLAGLGFAALLFALSANGGRILRFAALGVAVASLSKMALSDLSAFEGAARLAAFFGFAALIAVLLWLGLRDVMPASLLRGAVRPKTAPDTNLLPPG